MTGQHDSVGATTLSTTEVTEHDRPPATALTVVMALHLRSVRPQARQACYGRDHPVNHSELTGCIFFLW